MLVSGVIYIGETMQLVGCVCGLVLIIHIAIFFILRSRIMNTRYYDLRGKIVQAERRIAVLLFEQRHSRELILYDAAARYLKELKDSGEEITPKAWQ